MAKSASVGGARGRLTAGEGGLALMVIFVLSLMIVPVPTWALDILLSANLSMSVAILLVVLFVKEPIAVATFPIVLLITTLFRLGLNIASTRLILLQANAGDVIRSFGEFVVRGNFVVGAIVFLILTIIQFLVVAKGAERVAEVGARFVLDAMPGKQMAIDAELRGGGIDGNEARRRRRALARESQFYGAMDGAMKFVKGDVIASLVIVLINLIGGLAIGILQRDMDAVGALRRYGILSIGDGLVSQIPSMVLALAAAVLVTRVASEEEETPLGDELVKQLFGVPKALFVASAFVLLLGLVPGLPTLHFLVVAPALFFAGRARLKQMDREAQQVDALPRAQKVTARDADKPFVPVVIPLSFEVGTAIASWVADEGESLGVRSLAFALREQLFHELGVSAPPPFVAVSEQVGDRAVRLSAFEVPLAEVSFSETEGRRDLVVKGIDVLFPALRRRASEFLGLHDVQRALDMVEEHYPASVRNVVPKPMPLPLLAEVLRRLVDEGHSIRDLRAILEALAMASPQDRDPFALAELVRMQHKRAITHRVTRGATSVRIVIIDGIIEETIRRGIQQTPGGAFLALAPAVTRDIAVAMRGAFVDAEHTWGAQEQHVLLTQPDIRRFVRKLIELEFPDVMVVSFAELLPEVMLSVVGKVLPQ